MKNSAYFITILRKITQVNIAAMIWKSLYNFVVIFRFLRLFSEQKNIFNEKMPHCYFSLMKKKIDK